MPIQVALGTPLAEALSQAVQPKLVEIGWGNGGAEDAALAEYIILMLINGKTEQEIANDISGELLSLGPDDPAATEFARWLFQEIDNLDAQLSGTAQAESHAGAAAQTSPEKDTAMDTAGDVSELNAPTGPRSMRNSNGLGARGRDQRMFGQMNRAMDRSQDVLRRVRQTGNERINRGPPTGPRGAGPIGRQARGGRGIRPDAVQAGMAAMANHQMFPMPGMMPGMDQSMMQNQSLMAIVQEQSQMIQRISQQLDNQKSQHNGFHNRRGRDRGGHRGGGFRGQHHQSQPRHHPSEQTEDMEMMDGGAKSEPANPEESVCKFNLKCNNKDCMFAHQSPAAPPGTTIDVKDVCTFGAACKNYKCTARHPSPAARLAYQSDQDCKFYPNCQNPNCQFRHPTMPLCRNGPSCSTPNCKFTHVKTKCKYSPCLNRNCPFLHDEGQQGGFKDKVWTAESQENHVSERKFVDETAETEVIVADVDVDAAIV